MVSYAVVVAEAGVAVAAGTTMPTSTADVARATVFQLRIRAAGMRGVPSQRAAKYEELLEGVSFYAG
ncbi:hypothetical protein SGFS_074330 [Streptomyces graminofaciens]|uniref:Uncharacterized protein n=1 Tax=Streptomyces graminofaciens TaxID=68212 RepID=A0ABN5VRN5_9ACTN|nr:hypothetical protein SGFS_074330 [Streptomyces graminofaciens]